MVSTRSEEVSASIVSKNKPILGTVEYGVVDREHGCDSQYLLTTLVPVSCVGKEGYVTRISSPVVHM